MAMRQEHTEEKDQWRPGPGVPMGVMIAYDQMSREEQDRLRTLFRAITDQGFAALSTWGARLLDAAKGLYVLPLTEELRVFVRAEPEGPVEVLDITHIDTLRNFADAFRRA